MNISNIQFNDDGDFLVLYDGRGTQSPQIANVTNNDIGNLYNTSGIWLTIQMVSDQDGTSSGFRADWTSYSKILHAYIRWDPKPCRLDKSVACIPIS